MRRIIGSQAFYKLVTRLVPGSLSDTDHPQNRIVVGWLWAAFINRLARHRDNHLILEKWEGPPSGISTTVILTYRLAGEPAHDNRHGVLKLLDLIGIGKDWYKDDGGGEEWLRRERAQWKSPVDES